MSGVTRQPTNGRRYAGWDASGGADSRPTVGATRGGVRRAVPAADQRSALRGVGCVGQCRQPTNGRRYARRGASGVADSRPTVGATRGGVRREVPAADQRSALREAGCVGRCRQPTNGRRYAGWDASGGADSRSTVGATRGGMRRAVPTADQRSALRGVGCVGRWRRPGRARLCRQRGCLIGSTRRNLEPTPGVLSRSMRPWCLLTML